MGAPPIEAGGYVRDVVIDPTNYPVCVRSLLLMGTKLIGQIGVADRKADMRLITLELKRFFEQSAINDY
jgi:hypothetical protein